MKNDGGHASKFKWQGVAPAGVQHIINITTTNKIKRRRRRQKEEDEEQQQQQPFLLWR